jgi:hypothetical protein
MAFPGAIEWCSGTHVVHLEAEAKRPRHDERFLFSAAHLRPDTCQVDTNCSETLQACDIQGLC